MNAGGRTGHPSARRFRIRRHLRDFYPWTLIDRSRPAYLQHVETFAEAIALVDEKLRQEGWK